MSLGLPEFGTRGSVSAERGFARILKILGWLALAYALGSGLIEWRSAQDIEQALAQARAEQAQNAKASEDTRRSLQRNPDLLTLFASIESAPHAVLKDLTAVLPARVSIPSLKLDYGPDGVVRVEITLVAQSPVDYDRFLTALGRSDRFTDLKPGSETRPGPVRATVSASHRPAGGVR